LIPSQEQINQKAREIKSYLEDAVSEVAYSVPFEFQDEETKKKIKKALNAGVTDIKGWLADELYNDVNLLSDLSGDQIHDACTQLGVSWRDTDDFNKVFIMIATALSQNSHTALVNACDKLIRERKKTYKSSKDDPRSVLEQAL